MAGSIKVKRVDELRDAAVKSTREELTKLGVEKRRIDAIVAGFTDGFDKGAHALAAELHIDLDETS